MRALFSAPICFVVVFGLLVGACAPSSESDVSLEVQPGLFLSRKQKALREARENASLSERILFFADRFMGSSRARTPASASDLTPGVSCVGLNVMGANISSAVEQEGSAAWSDYKTEVLSGDTCSYPGKLSNAVSVDTGGTITVKVPFGASRVIQLVGYSGMDCSMSLSGSTLMDSDAVPGAYELGRSVTDIASASPTVELDFELDVLDSIETNETASSTDEFVPDIRCQAKGEPEAQYAELQAAAAATCEAGTYWTGTECSNVGAGYYSTGDGGRSSCSNAPAGTGVYTDLVASSSDCAWSCQAGYFKSGTSCVACVAGTYWDGTSCSSAGIGYYAVGDGVRQTCANAPASHAVYTDVAATSSSCSWSCETSYISTGDSCQSCSAGTYWNGDACVNVGIGYYSTGDGVQRTCSNGPESHGSYTNPAATSSSCEWTCAAGYYKTGATCSEVGEGYYSIGDGVRNGCANGPAHSHYTGTVTTSSSCAWDCDTNYLASGGGCVMASGLNCGAGEVLVGINVRAGQIIDRIGVRCAAISTTGIGSAYDGPAVGGMGGNAYTYNCPEDSILVEVAGGNGDSGYASSTASHRYRCRNIVTGVLGALSSQYGVASGITPFDYTCAAGTYPYGVNVGTDPSGSFSGFTLGTNCRACPAGLYSNGTGCVVVEAGYYSTGTGVRYACANSLPEFASFSATSTSATCSWSCNPGYEVVVNEATGASTCALPTSIITFNGNGGSGSMSPQSIVVGQSASLSVNAFSREGYLFAGWALTGTGGVTYNDGQVYTAGSGNVTLYAIWTLSSSLLAHYSFDSSNANDSSGHSNHGVTSNISFTADGSGGYAASFNGSSSSIRLPDDLIRGNSNFTIMMRFKATGSQHGALLGHQNSVVGGSAGNYVPILVVRSDGKLRGELWTSSGGLEIVSTGTVNDGQWHTVYFSANPGSIRLFLDGVQIGTSTGTINSLDMSYNQIGSALSAGRIYMPNASAAMNGWYYFSGLIDDLFFYNTAL